MVRPAGGITKDIRKRTIVEIVERWGRLNLEQISQHLASTTGFDAATARRTLYRDLEELVQEGILSEFRIAPDGATLHNYDPAIHRNTQCEWSLKDHKNAVKGGNFLEAVGGTLLASARVRSIVSLEPASAEKTGKCALGCIFVLGTELLLLRLSTEDLPLTLVISRAFRPTRSSGDTLAAYERILGKRVVLFTLPIATLSSSKLSNGRLGHCIVRFEATGKITLQDQNSTNGTFYDHLTSDETVEILNKAFEAAHTTLSPVLLDFMSHEKKIRRLEKGGQIELSLPLVLGLSDRFRLLIR